MQWWRGQCSPNRVNLSASPGTSRSGSTLDGSPRADTGRGQRCLKPRLSGVLNADLRANRAEEASNGRLGGLCVRLGRLWDSDVMGVRPHV